MRMKTRLTQATFAKMGGAAETVALPHTWNALDGQDGGNDYWRGIGTYEIDLPNPTPGKKQYIEIQGRTLFEEGWGEVDHDIVYKDAEDDEMLRDYSKLLNRLSGLADEMSSYFRRMKQERENNR